MTFGEQVRARPHPPDRTARQTFVKRTDVPVNMTVPLVRPAAGDCTQTGTAQQFADINKSLIVQSPEVWNEENNDEV